MLVPLTEKPKEGFPISSADPSVDRGFGHMTAPPCGSWQAALKQLLARREEDLAELDRRKGQYLAILGHERK